jgi:hypothetical protein
MMNKFIPVFLLLILIICQSSVKAADDEIYAVRSNETMTIDAQADESIWDSIEWNTIDQVWLPYGTTVDSSDFTGKFKVTWTPERLYFLVSVTDDLFSDQHADPLDSYWEDDCLEFFVDEDHSGGWHQDGPAAYNAFSYHIALDSNVVDIGQDGSPNLYNNNLHVSIAIDGNQGLWEIGIDLYDDTFEYGGDNTPVTLTSGKEVGLAIAYCDNDGTNVRENFIGSVYVTEENQNAAWQNASVFGLLTLVDELPGGTDPVTADNSIESSEISIYPNPADDFVHISNLTFQVDDISLLSADGKEIDLENRNVYQSGQDLQFDVSQLDAGMYFLILKGTNKTEALKLTVF